MCPVSLWARAGVCLCACVYARLVSRWSRAGSRAEENLRGVKVIYAEMRGNGDQKEG